MARVTALSLLLPLLATIATAATDGPGLLRGAAITTNEAEAAAKHAVDVKTRGASWGAKQVGVSVGGSSTAGGAVSAPGVEVTWGGGDGRTAPASSAASSSSSSSSGGGSLSGVAGGSVTAPGVNVTWGDGGAGGGANADPTQYPPPRVAGTEATGGNVTAELETAGVFRDSDGTCHWDWDDFVGSVYIRSLMTFKDHDSGTVTLRMKGRTGSCSDSGAPTYEGSFQILIEYGRKGYMRTAQTRFADVKHDGGLSAYNFDYTDAFTGMNSYDPGYDCGTATVTVFDDHCG